MAEHEGSSIEPRASVVVATYQRPQKTRRLLKLLDEQTLPPSDYEVIVVDDGSSSPFTDPAHHDYHSMVIRQANGGAGAARRNGVARARGDVIVIVDDDMIINKGFVAAHVEAHDRGCDVAIGRFVDADPNFPLFLAPTMTVHEEYFSRCEQSDEAVEPARLATGNVSFDRALYERVGGFDGSMRRLEDRELGVRLALGGGRFGFAHGADCEHDNDRTDLAEFLRTNRVHGQLDVDIARRHPDFAPADPFVLLGTLPLVARWIVLPCAVVPVLGNLVTRVEAACGRGAERLGLLWPARGFYKLALATTYATGVSEGIASVRRVLSELRAHHLFRRSPQPVSATGSPDPDRVAEDLIQR